MLSFIKYLKSLFQNVKGNFEPIIRKKETEQLPRERSKRVKESKLDLHRGEIVRALDSGATKASIAKKYGTSSVNLHYWLKRRKIKISKKLS